MPDTNTSSSGEELNITVAVRCRGRNEREIKAKSSVVVNCPDVMGSNEVSINTSGDVGITAQVNYKTYTVDKVFGPSADQSLLFKEIAEPMFYDFIRGYNCTMLVYGMTSTGKTYTMTGDEKLYDGELSDAAGIIPRVLFKLFDNLESQDSDYVVKCSFIELYNEELKDLLDENTDCVNYKRLRIFDSANGNNPSSRSTSRSNSPTVNSESKKRIRSGAIYRPKPKVQQPQLSQQQSLEQNSAIYIQNLQEFHITSAKEGLRLLQKGLKHRQVASTKMNDFSSRSHTIFTLMLYKEYNGELFRVSKINLVDLAGSENISRSGAQNQRAKEAGSINQSLLTLGRVINSLVDKNTHIPFRESKLTRLLQDSLGGNTKTALIATISPAKINSEETSSTLEYATKAKNIKNKPQLGSCVMKDLLVKNLSAELAKLKSDFLSTKSKDGIYMSHAHYNEVMSDIENYKTEIQESQRAVEKYSSQNQLLLKDKKASQEIIDSQRLQIRNIQSSMEYLYEKIDMKHKNELELTNLIIKLKDAVHRMQNALRDHENHGQQLQAEIQEMIYESVVEYRAMIDGTLNNLKDQAMKSTSTVDEDVFFIKSNLKQLLDSTREGTAKIFDELTENVLKTQPTVFKPLFEELDSISVHLAKHAQELQANLSSISEENNNLRDYLDLHFFKNNHQEILQVHADKAHHQLRTSSEEVMSKINEMLREQMEKTRDVLLETIQVATVDAISHEIELFNPIRKAWEKSFHKVNLCDSLGNNLNDSTESAIQHLKGRINASLEENNNIARSIKDKMNHFKEDPESLKVALDINKSIDDVQNKHQSLRLQLEKNVNFIRESGKGFRSLDESLQKIMSSKLSIDNNEDNIEALLQHVNARSVAPIASSGKTPLRLLNKQESEQRSHSRQISPVKNTPNVATNVSPLKRKSQEPPITESRCTKRTKALNST